MQSSADAVRLRSVDVVFSRDGTAVTALSSVDLEVPAGAFVTLIGPSGCGKSTLLRVVADLVPCAAGDAMVFGRSPDAARRQRELAFCFQDATLFPWRTAIENVRLPQQVGSRVTGEGLEPTAEQLLELVGLADRAQALPRELSGGMRQRVAIARALISRPRLLLMDEPFGALDEITRDHLNDELLRIWRETGATILFVTHSIAEAIYLAQEVVVMAANPGRILERVDLRPLKAGSAIDRDSPAFLEISRRLRRLLAQAGA
ncbi:MAG: ABC transporter ATP-binding protein [Alphaproteobacteria bacterium]